MSLLKFISDMEDRMLFRILVIAFLCFYIIQIPFFTIYADVLIYSIRSISEYPIIEYAFANYENRALPNYHIAHTVILWFTYQIMPEFLKNSIWPSGAISAIAGALSIGLVFLIWRRLNISKNISLVAALCFGFLPTIWHLNLIGLVYALQYLFVFLFIYLFLKEKFVFSSLSFTCANLVSPLSGICFSFLLLAEKNKKNLFSAIGVGFFSLAIYFIIIYLLDINILEVFKEVNKPDRSSLWKLYKFVFIILLNFSFVLVFAIPGTKKLVRNRLLLFSLIFGVAPQIVLIFSNSQFFTGKGGFFIMIFWVITLIIAYGITEMKKCGNYLLMALISTIIIYIFVWDLDSKFEGIERERAGMHLRTENLTDLKILGSWGHSVGIILGRNGWNINHINKYHIDIVFPTKSDIIDTKEDSLLIIVGKRNDIQKKLSQRFSSQADINKYDHLQLTEIGEMDKIYENELFSIYKWEKSSSQ